MWQCPIFGNESTCTVNWYWTGTLSHITGIASIHPPPDLRMNKESTSYHLLANPVNDVIKRTIPPPFHTIRLTSGKCQMENGNYLHWGEGRSAESTESDLSPLRFVVPFISSLAPHHKPHSWTGGQHGRQAVWPADDVLDVTHTSLTQALMCASHSAAWITHALKRWHRICHITTSAFLAS